MRRLAVLVLLTMLVLAPAAHAADRIIVLGVDTSEGGWIKVTVVFWFPVAAGEELPLPGVTSGFRGASAAELTALQTGAMAEEVHTVKLANTLTPAQIQGSLSAAWDARKAYRDGQMAAGEHYGATMNDLGTWRKPH